MPVFDNSQTMMAGSSAQSTGIDIGTYTGKSLMLNDDSSEYLNRTFGTANGDTWTFSCWIKRCKLGTTQVIFGRHGTNACLTFSAADKLEINDDGAAAYVTTNVFRDTNAWYHIVFTGNGTLNKLYVNNVLQTLDGSPNIGDINTNAEHRIGHNAAYGYADFYIAGVHFVDGQELLPEVFGHHSPDTKAWVMEEPPVAEAAASGGTESTDGQFKVHKFTSTSTLNVTQGGLIEYLVVAGGGGGGGNYGGGGGAGGFQTGTMYVPKGNYSITVGAGGDGGDRTGSTSGLDGDTGANSVFHTITSLGGGGGGATDSDEDGEPGGSGGGSRYGGAVGAGTSGQGYNGGTGSTSGSNYGSGGGGGASEVGTGGSGSAGGVGGDGIASTISGSSVTYAGGGGGGTYQGGTHGNGGSGGGGNGATAVDSGTVGGTGVAGTVNTGGGGGGGSAGSNGGIGGDGGSGIVIVRYYNPTTLDYGDNGFKLEFKESGGIERGGETEFTLPAAGTLTRTHAGNDDSSAYFDRVLTGNWSLQWTCKSDNSHSSGDSMRIGVVPATTRGSWTFTNSTGGAATNHHVLFGSGNLGQCTTQAGQDNSHSAVGSISGTFKLTREGGDTIKFYHDSGSGFALDHTFSVTSSADMVFFFGSGEKSNTNSLENFTFNDDGTGTSGNFYTLSLGNDVSGNNNDWIIEEGVHQTADSPTNNFWTLSHNIKLNEGAITKGGLHYIRGSESNHGTSYSMPLPQHGKWYWEINVGSATNNGMFGVSDIAPGQIASGSELGGGANDYGYRSNGLKRNNGSDVTTDFDSWTESDNRTVSVAWDADNGNIWFARDGVWQGASSPNPATGTAAAYSSIPSKNSYCAAGSTAESGVGDLWNFGCPATTDTIITGNTDANGHGNFEYAPPSGSHGDFLALCTANMEDPDIGGISTSHGTDYVNAITYAGNGSDGARAISGVGFTAGMVWQKIRAGTTQGFGAWDIARTFAAGKALDMSTDTAEGTWVGSNSSEYGDITAVGTDTITVNDGSTAGSGGFVNTSGRTYILYAFKAGTSFTNNSGTNSATITTTGQHNEDSKFAVFTYTGNNTDNAKIYHPLGVVPDVVIVRRRDSAGGWYVYHSMNTSAPETEYLRINTNDATTDSDATWSDDAPTSTLITLKDNDAVNGSSATYVAWAWANGDAFQSGRYEGNNDADGPFCYCGFRPQVIITKRVDSGDHWRIIDVARESTNQTSYPGFKMNETDAEADAGSRNIDFLSNGFKVRETDPDSNASGGDYIFLAWAHTPFKYANAY